jgi:hypothetical protein
MSFCVDRARAFPEKEYRYPKTGKASESMGARFDMLDPTVESLRHRIGCPMAEIRQQPGEMAFEHVGHFRQMPYTKCV